MVGYKMFDYESPIEAILGQIQTQFEDDCVKAVQSYGFNINKEELKKALLYDRGQYEKGYAAAKEEFKRPPGEWILLDDCSNEGVYCSNCYKKVYRTEYANQKVKSNFCPNCGADMRGTDNGTDKTD